MKSRTIEVKGVAIKIDDRDYISLSDICQGFEAGTGLILSWIRNRTTIEFLGIWETLFNPDFNSIEFDGIKKEAGLNSFAMSPKKWSETTRGIGLSSKAGRYGAGVFAHSDIAAHFCSWLSPEFHLLMIREYQKLKSLENPEWHMRRALSKVNYELHTGAIRKHILPAMKGNLRAAAITALTEEADMLNLAIFGVTAAQWRTKNPDMVAKGMNIRDTADIYQLLVLANMESYNETLIHYGMSKEDRFQELEKAANRQLDSLYQHMKRLPAELLQSPNLLPPTNNG